MKNSKLKYLFLASLMLMVTTVVTLYSCEKAAITPSERTLEGNDAEGDFSIPEPNSICGNIENKFLIDEHGHKIGEALIYNSKKYFYVYLTTKEGIFMRDVYLHVTDKMEKIPLDQNGDPFYKIFKYQIVGKSLSNVRKIRVSLKDMEGVSLVTVMAQTFDMNDEDVNGEIDLSWVDGRIYGKTLLGRVFTYEKQICKSLPLGTEIN